MNQKRKKHMLSCPAGGWQDAVRLAHDMVDCFVSPRPLLDRALSLRMSFTFGHNARSTIPPQFPEPQTIHYMRSDIRRIWSGSVFQAINPLLNVH